MPLLKNPGNSKFKADMKYRENVKWSEQFDLQRAVCVAGDHSKERCGPRV